MLACEMNAIVWYVENVLLHCPSLGLESKLTFSISVAIAEFSKFDILSATGQSWGLMLFYSLCNFSIPSHLLLK